MATTLALIDILEDDEIEEAVDRLLDALGIEDDDELEKHGDHDQRSHGNREGGSETREQGGRSGGGSSVSDNVRALRAKHSHIPHTKAKKAVANKHERKVASLVKGKDIPGNEPFDVIRGKHALEVKTIQEGKNPKITMHPESLARKVSYAKKHGLESHTVVIDLRGSSPVYYHKKGVGSFRLTTMTKVGAQQLESLIK